MYHSIIAYLSTESQIDLAKQWIKETLSPWQIPVELFEILLRVNFLRRWHEFDAIHFDVYANAQA